MRIFAFAFVAASLGACAAPQSALQSFTAQPFTGAVSSAEPRATAAGDMLLAQGGSATDAALATLVALTVVEPQSSGIGGGSFMLRSDADGNLVTYDGRETAPMAATEDWFIGADGEPVAFGSVVPGGRSVGVPGNVALMKAAHDAHGRANWPSLFVPAIELAEWGFPMTRRLHDYLERMPDHAGMTAEARAIYYRADGTPHPIGTTVRNPALGAFLRRLAAEGPAAFYAGENAQAIAATVSTADTAPAPMQVSDLAGYEAKMRPPVCVAYRDHRVCSMGPPSSGATTVLQILKLLERFDLAAMDADDPVFWHLFAEATRLAYADRAVFLGDADFVDVPVRGLLDDIYLAGRSELIDPGQAAPNVDAGTPPGSLRIMAGDEPLERGTSHFAAADADGNVVSITSTIEGPFGSGLMVNGYYLNNELTDFSFAPRGSDGQPVANRVQPGKRPRSSMSPTIVFDSEGEPVLAIGAAGGPTIITQTAKNIIAILDLRMTAQAAIDLRNVYAPGSQVLVEEGPGSERLVAALAALGHDARIIGPRFKANAVQKIGGRWVAATDPRTQKDVQTELAP